MRRIPSDDDVKNEKSERRGQALANGNAMKRGGFAQRMIDAKSDEDEATGQGRIHARLETIKGRAMLIEQCISMRLSWLKAQCGVRDYDALYDLCVFLEGGGNVTLSASCVCPCAKFVPSFC